MNKDLIAEIGITENNLLYLKPQSKNFAMIYREAMEVHWNIEEKYLYHPRLAEWSHFQWYQQILKAAREQSTELTLSPETVWRNVPQNLRDSIEQYKPE